MHRDAVHTLGPLEARLEVALRRDGILGGVELATEELASRAERQTIEHVERTPQPL